MRPLRPAADARPREEPGLSDVVRAFVVRADGVDRFERAYGSNGSWARLFEQYPGYRGTVLCRDTANPRRYATIDLWESVEQRTAMLAASRLAYDALDRVCESLTEAENEIGVFEVLSGPPDLGGRP